MNLDGARSTYDLNRDFEKDLAGRRKKQWANKGRAELLDEVRRLTGIRKLAELPEAKVINSGTVERDGYQIRKMILTPEDGIYLPALMFVPDSEAKHPTVLYIHERGKATAIEPIEAIVKSGKCVLAVDVRGTGETQQSKQNKFTDAIGLDWKDVFTAYLLGRSYVGMRTEDVLVCARVAGILPAIRGRDALDTAGPVELIAAGNVTIPALHAAALEPDLFGSVKLTGMLSSWSNVIESGRSYNQQVNSVHGALTTYDLPDLTATLGDKLIIKEPLNALGQPR
jgi:hypothetical protein